MRRSILSPLSIAVIAMFFHTHVYALGAGVPWGGTGSVNLVGFWSVLMLPQASVDLEDDPADFDPFLPVDPDEFFGSSTLGLALWTVNADNTVSGQMVAFLEDYAFEGDIIGLADPRKSQIFNVVDLQSLTSFIAVTGDGDSTTTITYFLTGGGRILATASKGEAGPGIFASGNILTGNATFNYDTEEFPYRGTTNFSLDGVYVSQGTSSRFTTFGQEN